jgi:cellulose synthase/poly-beta-1,6-N-acetylglucosamine synthase-like glycosyltransferase
MEVMETFIHIFFLIVYIYLTVTVVYLLFFTLASLLPLKKKSQSSGSELSRIAIIIPCYREDAIILEVAREALKQNYPKAMFDVVIVADDFKAETIRKLQELPLILFDEKFEISTKTRAINHALLHLPEHYYQAVCILDADNIMESDFLMKMNAALANGQIAVQGHRVAKNLNTPFAVLDAISEEINNQIFRKGQQVIGLSSALIGSAMVFEYQFFKSLMSDIEVVGGFDKEIELRLMRDGYHISYVPDAYVYDEKVQTVRVFTSQRRRWLSAQFHYFGIHFLPALKSLIFNGNVEYFNKAFQYLQLPRILVLGLLLLLTVSSLLFQVPKHPYLWFYSLIFIVLALLLAIPLKFYRKEIFKAILFLPLGFSFMFLSLLNIRGANEKFIHTKHTYNAFQIKKKKSKKQ